MTILGLDTTTPQGSVAIWRDGAIRALGPTDAGRPYSDQLPGAIDDLLRSLGWTFTEVDVFAVASGPGSLTGLRVGISTIQGLALALGRQVVAVSALEALATAAAIAMPGLTEGDCAGALTDAHRGELFGALYVVESQGPGGSRLSEVHGPTVGPPAQVVARWAPLVRGRRARVTGNAAVASTAWIVDALGAGATVLPAPLLAGTVAELAARQAARGLAMAPHALQPLYVRRPDAEVARDAVRERQHAPRTPR